MINSFLTSKKRVQTLSYFFFFFCLIMLSSDLFAQGQWEAKVSTAANSGANSIKNILDGITSLIMAISAVMFLVGIVQAGMKYKSGDREAFKHLGGVFYGSLIILLGSGLAKTLFF